MVALIFRIIWQIFPGLLWCSIFWFSFLISEIFIFTGLKYKSSKFARIFLYIGAFSNATVTLANGGYMPVVHGDDFSLWVASNSSHNLMMLADIYSGFSIGDFFIATGVVIALLFWIFRKTYILESSSQG